MFETQATKLLGRRPYEAALRGDPELSDCCYNLALLYRKQERPRDAIRYMSQYRRLLGAQVES